MEMKPTVSDKNTESEQLKADIQVEFENSFHTSRFPRLPWALLLLVYVPFGLFLTLLRVCMSLQAMLLLLLFPEGSVKRFLLRIFFGVLGIVVITDSFHRKGSQTKVFLSNKLSWVDHIVLHLALDCITVSTGGRAPALHFLFRHHTLSASSDQGLETEAQKLPGLDESMSLEKFSPFVFQPEPMATNGTYTLLQFSMWPCSLSSNVQPIALTAYRPFGIKLTTVYSSRWWDVFWILFTPFTVFCVKLLPPMERREGEAASELCERTQASLREELKLRESEFTLDDITTWMEAQKKKAQPPTSASQPPSPIPTPAPPPTNQVPDDIEVMVEQVSTVMPQVPCTAIRKDLLSTRSVDATITNLLEGVVAYDALPPPQPKTLIITPSPSRTPSLKSSDLRPRKYYSPAMEAMRRQLSLDERKKQLLENARKQYMEKHGLNVNI